MDFNYFVFNYFHYTYPFGRELNYFTYILMINQQSSKEK